MNKIQIFFFLISMEIFTSLLKEKNFNSLIDDFLKCKSEKDTQKCSAVQFERKSFQCCSLKTITTIEDDAPEEEKNCMATINPIKPAKDEIVTQDGKLMIKEYLGFTFFGPQKYTRDLSYEYEYTCKDGKFGFKVDTTEYSVEEKRRYKNENLCMRFFDEDYPKESITKETCFNSILGITDNSTISCGFFEFTLNFKDRTNGNYKTCFPISEDTIKNKNIGFLIKYIAEVEANNAAVNQNKELINYKLTITNSKGEYFNYDSSKDSYYANADVYLSKFISFKFLYMLLLILI